MTTAEPQTPSGRELRIGDLAKATGKSARALRLYEELGLLTPGTRTAGGFRVYGAEAIGRVRWIATQQDLGFTLHDVKDLVDSAGSAGVPRQAMAEVRHRYQQKLDELDTQLERLTALRHEVIESLRYLEVCGGCTAEHDGAQTCLVCDEHDEPSPQLIHQVTRSASEAAQKESER